jgi:CheY-like chemotaxis protein
MSKSGPILIIEDDAEDKEILEDILRELDVKNKILWAENTNEAFSILGAAKEPMFIIFCDINLPGKNGLELKLKIDEHPELRKKSIPFLFYSTSANQKDVNDAYSKMTIQGFFKKGSEYKEMKNLIRIILDYWRACRHPNDLEYS